MPPSASNWRATVDVDAVISLPLHPFDPAGWQSLGRETLREALVEAKRIAFADRAAYLGTAE